MRKPSFLILLARVVVISFLAALLTFAVFLLFGIVGVVLVNLIRGGGISLPFAYRRIAFPAGLTGFTVAAILALLGEGKRYREALAEFRAQLIAESGNRVI